MHRWFKDGIQLEDDRKHQIQSDVQTGILTLTIKRAEEADLGQYQCEVPESSDTFWLLYIIQYLDHIIYFFSVFMIQLQNEVGSAKCKAELCPPAPLLVTVRAQKQSQTTPTPGRMKRNVNSNCCLRQRSCVFGHSSLTVCWWAPVGFEGAHTTVIFNDFPSIPHVPSLELQIFWVSIPLL